MFIMYFAVPHAAFPLAALPRAALLRAALPRAALLRAALLRALLPRAARSRAEISRAARPSAACLLAAHPRAARLKFHVLHVPVIHSRVEIARVQVCSLWDTYKKQSRLCFSFTQDNVSKSSTVQFT
jgi:hypothetical protein